MSRTDEDLADLVAHDIEAYLETLRVESSVYAIALWIDDGSGAADETAQYGLSVGTEGESDRQRAACNIPHERWAHWPSSERWNSGNWSHLVEDFLTSSTESALEPLREIIRQEGFENEDAGFDFSWPGSDQFPGVTRWHEIAIKALTSISLPSTLPATADVVVYPEGPDLICAQRAHGMLCTIEPNRFHKAFPAWRRMAEAVRSARADDALMAELRARVDGESASARFPRFHEEPPDELTMLLMACDLHWFDVTTWSDPLRSALRVADHR